MARRPFLPHLPHPQHSIRARTGASKHERQKQQRPGVERRPPQPQILPKGIDVEVQGKTVRVVGLPNVPPERPDADVDVGGIMAEVNKTILDEIKGMVEGEELLDDED